VGGYIEIFRDIRKGRVKGLPKRRFRRRRRGTTRGLIEERLKKLVYFRTLVDRAAQLNGTQGL